MAKITDHVIGHFKKVAGEFTLEDGPPDWSGDFQWEKYPPPEGWKPIMEALEAEFPLPRGEGHILMAKKYLESGALASMGINNLDDFQTARREALRPFSVLGARRKKSTKKSEKSSKKSSKKSRKKSRKKSTKKYRKKTRWIENFSGNPSKGTARVGQRPSFFVLHNLALVATVQICSHLFRLLS